MTRYILVFSVLSILLISSCSTFQRSIATEEDRKTELYALMPKVTRAYRWVAFEELAPMFSNKISIDSVQQMHKFYKNLKVKEVDVEQIDFEEEANKAYVILQVKTFSAPRYMIESHLDQITWKYSVKGGGWQIVKMDIGSSKDIGGGSTSEEIELP